VLQLLIQSSLFTSSTSQLCYGKIYAVFPAKTVYLVAIGIFELGSLLCGIAPTSNALIIGRAMAGIGSAGIMSGVMRYVGTLLH
jgi:MFS family permease